MRRKINLFSLTSFSVFCLSFLLILLNLQAQESLTITTYYPSPHGRYRDMESQTTRYTPATLEEIENRFNCSNITTTPHPCEGLMYYDVNEKTFFYFDGREWRTIYSNINLPPQNPDVDALAIGAYGLDLHESLSTDDMSSTASLIIGRVWDDSNEGIEGVMDGINKYYGNFDRFDETAAGNGYARINFQALPKGNYILAWSAEIDIDQWIVVRDIYKKSGGRWIKLANPSPEYEEVKDEFLEEMRGESGSLYKYGCWLELIWVGCKVLDQSEKIYDENIVDGNGQWDNPDNYSSEEINRQYFLSLGPFKRQKPCYKSFALRMRKEAGRSNCRKSITYDYAGSSTKYRVHYDIKVKVRYRHPRVYFALGQY